MNQFDLVVIGAGPGGYVAAIRGAQLGYKTALIEKRGTLGGTCLNVGCIPSKALLDSSEHYLKAKKEFDIHGIQVSDLGIDFPRMIARKQEVVDQTVAGVDFLMEKNGITVLNGFGSFVDAHTLEVKKDGGEAEQIKADRILIATGSEPASLPFIQLDGDRIITSTEALELPALPERMVIIGGGVIGLELGSVYARLGTEVHVVEYQNAIIPTMDRTMGKELQRAMKKIGVKFHLSHGVKEVVNAGDKAIVKADNKKGEEVTWEADYCLVAVGRKPYTEGLGLDKAGISLDDRGRVEVDGHLHRTSAHLRHRRRGEGRHARPQGRGGGHLRRRAHGRTEAAPRPQPHPRRRLRGPRWPLLADRGAAQSRRHAYKTGSFPFKASGRARASMDTDGVVKVLAHQETDEILGVHICGPRAADMIAEAVVAMEYRASAEDIARMSHAHPTFTEAVKEAALAATGDRALHI